MDIPENLLRLLIKLATVDGELIKDVKIDRTSTVGLLKQVIRRETSGLAGWEDFEPQNQRLIFGGDVLGNDAKVLSEIRNLANDSVIMLTRRRNQDQGTDFTWI